MPVTAPGLCAHWLAGRHAGLGNVSVRACPSQVLAHSSVGHCCAYRKYTFAELKEIRRLNPGSPHGEAKCSKSASPLIIMVFSRLLAATQLRGKIHKKDSW